MKFSHTLVIGALLGYISINDVQAVAIRNAEAEELMQSIDVDEEEAVERKHKKHHKRGRKHHRHHHQNKELV